MYYSVTARFKPETADEFLQKLTDGTIASQKPDGKEIVASMKLAAIDEEGVVRWSEKCFCPMPLQHERETVYNRFFDTITTEEIDNDVEFEGKEFMTYLEQVANP